MSGQVRMIWSSSTMGCVLKSFLQERGGQTGEGGQTGRGEDRQEREDRGRTDRGQTDRVNGPAEGHWVSLIHRCLCLWFCLKKSSLTNSVPSGDLYPVRRMCHINGNERLLIVRLDLNFLITR